MIRRLLITCVACLLGYWLFGDTYRRHFGSPDQHTIRFAHFGTYQDFQLWRELIEVFSRDHPAATIVQEYVVGLGGHYNTKMRQQVLSGTLPDVALVQLGPFHDLADDFADLSDLLLGGEESAILAADVLDATALAAFRHGDRQAGLPVSGGNLLMYVNDLCFKRAGKFRGQVIPLPAPDWTMVDFRRTAELLTCDFDGDGTIDQFGFWLPRWVYYLPFLWSFGAELTDSSVTEWRLAGAEAEAALAFYRGLAVGDRVSPRFDEVPQMFQDVGFLTGKVGMCVNGPWFMPFLAETNLADSYFVAPIPIGPGGRSTRITWDAIVVRRGLPTERDRLARRFVAFLMSASSQRKIAATGRSLPSRADVLSAFVDLGSDVSNRVRANRSAFVEAVSYSRLQPLFQRFGQTDRAINRCLVRAIDPANTESPRDLLARLARDQAIQTSFGSTVEATP